MTATSLIPARLVENLPDSPRAKLPETYQRAKDELARCDRIDECKDWSDKALALAAYARQAKDEQFLAMAVRIQTRAIARAGELLAEIEAGKNRFDNRRVGAGPSINRRQAAADAGLSERQRKTALRVATFKRKNPERYERMLEGPKPPSPTKLAEMGIHRNPSRSREEFRAATRYLGLIKSLRQFLDEDSSPKSIVAGLGWDHEIESAYQNTRVVATKIKELEKELLKCKRQSKRKSRKFTKK